MPKISEHSKNKLRLRNGKERLFWILHKIMVIICFLANVCRCNITCTTFEFKCFQIFIIIIIIYIIIIIIIIITIIIIII